MQTGEIEQLLQMWEPSTHPPSQPDRPVGLVASIPMTQLHGRTPDAFSDSMYASASWSGGAGSTMSSDREGTGVAIPSLSDDFVRLMMKFNGPDVNMQQDERCLLDSLAHFKKELELVKDQPMVNMAEWYITYPWLQDAIKQSDIKVQLNSRTKIDCVTDSSGSVRDAPSSKDTVLKFEKMMKERGYEFESRSELSGESALEPVMVDVPSLFAMIDVFERRHKTIDRGDQLRDTISSVIVEMNDAQTKFMEYNERDQKLEKIKKDASAIATQILKLHEDCQALKLTKDDDKFPIETVLKSGVENVLSRLDSDEVAANKAKLNETATRVKHLRAVTEQITQAHNLARKFQNEPVPVSDTSTNTPTCNICMTNNVDSCYTCGHMGCEECLIKCESQCPFCKRPGGLIKLFL